MGKVKRVIEKSFFIMILIVLAIAGGSSKNLKKAKAATMYQYLVVINKPHELDGDLQGIIDGMVSANKDIKKIDMPSHLEVRISSETDLSMQYKEIVAAINSSTVHRKGYYMKARVSFGQSITDEAQEVSIDTAKDMIAGDSSNHRAIFIGWECNHKADNSTWKLTSPATCQHADMYTCSVCGEEKAEGTNTPHDYSIRYNEPTCTELAVYRCVTCNNTIVTGEYGEHNYIFEDVVMPTEVSSGYTRKECECGAYYDEKFTYKIEYDSNGGIGEIGSQIVNFDSNEILQSNTFVKEGHYFNGWNTSEDGTGTEYKEGQLVNNISSSTIRLYADWKKIRYTVTCVDCYEDGSVIDSINNNKTLKIESGEMISGENFGTNRELGAYYPGMCYVSSDEAVEVSDDIIVKRYFKSYKEYGLTDAVIVGDTLEKVSGKHENIIIPEEIKKIGEGAFSENSNVVSVEIKNGTVTQIEDNAFENCSNLKKIILPYSVIKIGKNAFRGCDSLETIEIKNPDCEIDASNDTIPEKTIISGFSNSSSATYSKKNHREFKRITTIYDNFFFKEKYLESFTIPDDVETIGNGSFKQCVNLKKINLGKITSIGESAFEDCISLKYEKDFSKEQTEALKIPATVKRIGNSAFFNDKKIAQITFEGKDIIIEDKTAIDTDTIVGCYAGSALHDFVRKNKMKVALFIGFDNDVKAGMAKDYKNNSEIKALIIKGDIKEIDKFSFAGCMGLECVKIYADDNKVSKIKIGNSAFFNCSQLDTFECEENVEIEMIDDNAFSGCKNLSEFVINNANCIISDREEIFDDNTIIKGWSNSTAKAYCEKYNKKFKQTGVSYIVNLNKNGGIGGTEKIYMYSGMNMPSIIIPEKKGYNFKGYFIGDKRYYDESGKYVSEEKTDEATMTDKTFDAVWGEKKYNVIFAPNGGIGKMEMLTKVEYDSDFLAPENKFVREGYHFVGWSISEKGQENIYKTGDKIKNLTQNDGESVRLYAQWKENTYKIEYNLNGGTGKSPENTDALYNGEYVISDNFSTKEFYTFNGWNTRYDGRGENYSVGQRIKQLLEGQDEVITLYAQWKPVEYNIRLNLNGGQLSGDLTSLRYNCETENFEIKEPKKHGYEFTGWNETNDGKITKNIVIKKGSHGDMELNANYKPSEYNIKFETNGGKFKDSSKVVKSYMFGDSINLPTDVEKNNYIFKGWSTKKDAGNADTTRIVATDTGDKVYYAVWSPASYNITYVTDGGNITDVEKAAAYLYGTGIRLPENVIKEGYSFAGWYPDEKCAGQIVTRVTATDTGDKKFYAKWIPDGNNNTKESENKPQESPNPENNGDGEKDDIKEPVTPTQAPLEITTSRPHQSQGAGKEEENNKKTQNNKTKKVFKYGDYNKNKKTVALKKVCDTKIKKAVVPDTVKYNGVKYKVTVISSGAFKNCKQLNKITLGKNVKTVGKNCFKNCRKLKKITVKSKTLSKVGKNSLKNTNKKLSIKCKKKQIKKYRKLFKNKGNKTYKIRKIQ